MNNLYLLALNRLTSLQTIVDYFTFPISVVEVFYNKSFVKAII